MSNSEYVERDVNSENSQWESLCGQRMSESQSLSVDADGYLAERRAEQKRYAREHALDAIESAEQREKSKEFDEGRKRDQEAIREFKVEEELPLVLYKEEGLAQITYLKKVGKNDEITDTLRIQAAYGEDIGPEAARNGFDSELSLLRMKRKKLERRGRLNETTEEHLADMLKMEQSSSEREAYGRRKHAYYELLKEAKKSWPQQYKQHMKAARVKLPWKWDDGRYSAEDYLDHYEAIRDRKVKDFLRRKRFADGEGPSYKLSKF